MKMTPILLIAVGGIIGIIGTGLALYGTYKHNKNSSERNKNIDSNVTENLGLTQGIDTTTKETKIITNSTNENTVELKKQNSQLIEKINTQQGTIDNLRKENTELYSKLAEKALGIYNNVTGGDSYLDLYMLPDGNRLRLSGSVQGEKKGVPGKYTIENLSLNVFQNGVVISFIDQKNYNISQDYTIGYYDFPQQQNFVTYSIRIFSKNGNYLQFFNFKKHSDKKWYCHRLQLYDIYGFKLRFNEFESNYPEELKQKYLESDFEIRQILARIEK